MSIAVAFHKELWNYVRRNEEASAEDIVSQARWIYRRLANKRLNSRQRRSLRHELRRILTTAEKGKRREQAYWDRRLQALRSDSAGFGYVK